ncbi:MAG: hypothetical protein HUU28_07610 [Planctomycetaceae bacterium]|nr:hypothetical protein [Planctomycetaceae bacterium]
MADVLQREVVDPRADPRDRRRLGAGLELAAGVGWLEAERTGGGDSDLVFSIFGPRVGLVWGW